MNEGYEEIDIINPLNSGIMKTIKSCNNCTHIKKSVLLKSGPNPIHMDLCNADSDVLILSKRKIHKNVFGYYEPPGFDGEDCPFHQQLLRNKKIKNILNENNR